MLFVFSIISTWIRVALVVEEFLDCALDAEDLKLSAFLIIVLIVDVTE
ncbi:hypothetical protein T09_10109 [Trichinella sp. T9]|nr:hypothetical protein T09_10109 [Trichinella sp. T9]